MIFRLFCLPYAGARPAVFTTWTAALQPRIEVCAVEIRQVLGSDSATAMDATVAALADRLAPHLEEPFALFGHSLGALVAFELARELRRRGARAPSHLFVSGAAAPSERQRRPSVSTFSDAELVTQLRRFGGTPEEVLDDPELLYLVLPKVRADLAMFEHYVYLPERPLATPIIAFSGSRDALAPATSVERWRPHTTGRFSHWTLPGGHFFLSSAQASLLALLAGEVS